MRMLLYLSLGFALPGLAGCGSADHVARAPNIVLIYVDDLGYGDVAAYGARPDLTPNVDQLAEQGLRFTDAHSAAATCTPSRYALLTGSYAFRNTADILQGDAPLLIPPTTRTLADVLHDAGYTTGIVGKWHLGLGDGDVDWNMAVEPGPLELGFDDAFIIPATGDRVPTVYLENHHVVGVEPTDPIAVSYGPPIDDSPTGRTHPHLLTQGADVQHSDTIVNGVSRIGFMAGGERARWTDEDMADVLAVKAKAFIADNRRDPFFLFFSFHDIHVPRVPNERFADRTGMGPRGDAIAQMDWVTGQLIQELRAHDLEEHTLVIFTSDNGPVLDDGYADEAVTRLGEHRPAGVYRGGKYSAYEAGTRVPTFVSWPNRVEPGTSNALVSQVDLLASLARLVDVELEPADAPDSFDELDAWLGRSAEGREALIEESYTLSLRRAEWKYVRPASDEGYAWIEDDKDLESGLLEIDQLFNLALDEQEQQNVSDQYPEVLGELRSQLNQMTVARGTRPGYEPPE